VSTDIILIRHGETAWNAERRLQGHIDIGLNEEGLRQAEALGAALSAERIDAIVASDLLRAQHTAQAVARHHRLPVRLDARLRERCYGAFEGLLYAEIKARYPQEFAAMQAREVDAVLPPGERAGESFRQFYQRTVQAVHALAAAHPGQVLALVAHGGVLECIYRAAMAMPLDTPRNFDVMNASINRFTVTADQIVLTCWGDVAHLQAGALDELS
jgi:2,3-bisphosphoglycerate-dependent phosphoglycerate mutase